MRGAALRAGLVDLADRFLTDLLGAEPGVALVAVGGYGRSEPAPGSDLDLVLLHADRRDIAAVAERVWYPIWDSGVPLDHAVRTVEQARALARTDLRVALGLLDARHVAGDETLSAAVSHAVRQDWRGGASRRLPEVIADSRRRAEDNGELAHLLEPDLKTSFGGLREMTALRAAAAAWALDPPRGAVLEAARLLLDVRGELHRTTGRAGDRLVAQEQAGVAATLGYGDADALLTAVSAAGRTIGHSASSAWRRLTAPAERPRRWRRSGPPLRRPLAAGVVAQDGEVVLARDADPAGDPLLALRASAAAAAADLPLAAYLVERLVCDSAPLPVPWPPAARDALVALLGAGRPAVTVLETLDQAGLLVRLVPEWGAVRFRPQHNPVHRHTVDRHLMETVVEAAALTRRVARPDLLLLGALLHDIGKCGDGDHSEVGARLVAKIAPRLGLDPHDSATLVALVRHHLLLPDTATRRDLDDPATVDLVATATVDQPTLELLAALTEADARAAGPLTWTDWRAGLVADLVNRVTARLAGEPAPDSTPLLEPMALPDEEVAAVLIEERVGELTVTVTAPDRRGLLWRAAGVLALHSLEVRSASAGLRQGTAVATFTVTPRFGRTPEPELLTADLRRVFADRLDVTARLAARAAAYEVGPALLPAAAPTVRFDDAASRSATVVEVRAHDRAGLLHRLARVLDDSGLAVRAARVDTYGAEAVDSFYVTVDDALLADESRRASLAAALLEAARD